MPYGETNDHLTTTDSSPFRKEGPLLLDSCVSAHLTKSLYTSVYEEDKNFVSLNVSKGKKIKVVQM